MRDIIGESGFCAGFIMPHPPVLIPEIGKGRETAAGKTAEGYRCVASRIADIKPDTIVIVSPHAPLFGDFLFVYDEPVLSGSFARFGSSSLSLSAAQDSPFVRAFRNALLDAGISGGTCSRSVLDRYEIDPGLDHGVLVPLYFILEAYKDFQLVCLSSSAFDQRTVLRVGGLLSKVASSRGKRVCIVASGDLSHKVTAESPYGMVPEGEAFDREITSAVASGRLADVLSIDAGLREAAAECGYNAIVMLAGALGFDAERGGPSMKSTLYSDEAPFGIGYCLAGFEPTAEVSSWQGSLARSVIASFVRTGRIPPVSGAGSHGSESAGCFVSLKIAGVLRGCIGTIHAVTGSLEDEIARNAVAACSEDPRFEPVTEEELLSLEISVDVLGKSEGVSSRANLDPRRFGVIVSAGMRRGLLLPDLEGVDTVDEQLSIACRKGGIDPAGDFAVERFTVTRFR
jgi:MEMO1 family protein